MKNLNLLFIVLLFSAVAAPAHAIKKCKDADGNWHYGDTAVSECENSKITTLNDRGFVKEEQEAPKSEAEILADEEAMAVKNAEEKRIRLEQEERNRILSIYETEADIDRQRDNQIDSVDGNIAVHKAYLKAMDSKIARLDKELATAKGYRQKKITTDIETSKKRVVDSAKELESLKEQKTKIVARFAKEKELYRELKGLAE